MGKVYLWLKTKLNNIRRMSQIKLFSILIAIIVVSITIITLFSYNLLINQAKSRYVSSLNMETQQLAGIISSELGNLLSIGRMMAADDKIRSEINLYHMGSETFEDVKEKLDQYILEYESTTFMASSLVPEIAIIMRDNNYFGDELVPGTFLTREFRNELYSLYSTNRNVKWTSDSEMFGKEKPSATDCMYLLVAIRDRNTFRSIGTIVIQLRVNIIASRILPNMYSYQSAFVITQNGKRIVDLDYLGISDELDQWIDLSSIEVQNNQTEEQNVRGMDCVISNYAISKSEWYIITISNMDDYALSKKITMRNVLLAVAVVSAVAFLLAYDLSKKFMKPVIDLNRQMNLVKEGNFDVHLEPTTNDEIGELTEQFNDMVDHISTLIELNKKEQEEKRLSDFNFLQTQINPHFIYNTLTLIRYNFLINDRNQADEIILALNNILRYVLSDSSQFVTLNRALEWLRNYLVIVDCSLKEPVSVIYDIEEGTENCQIIRMLIQPLVENAAFHGLKNCTESPKLKISSKISQGDLIISIWDNGPGFDTEKLKEVRSDLERKSIGVDNVAQRIRLYYGEDRYGISFRSFREGLEVGTEATIVVPAIIKKEGDVLINEYSGR